MRSDGRERKGSWSILCPLRLFTLACAFFSGSLSVLSLPIEMELGLARGLRNFRLVLENEINSALTCSIAKHFQPKAKL